ncbi:MAG: hypothetical protein MI919_17560 [Holophagales bacterium]|nr:hypothetical protein [Holophagales bacterium]
MSSTAPLYAALALALVALALALLVARLAWRLRARQQALETTLASHGEEAHARALGHDRRFDHLEERLEQIATTTRIEQMADLVRRGARSGELEPARAELLLHSLRQLHGEGTVESETGGPEAGAE